MRPMLLITIISHLIVFFSGLSSCAEPLREGDSQICIDDPFYVGLWHNPEIFYDASTYCVSLLSLTPATTYTGTTTIRTTIFPSASTTTTVIATTSSPTSTITVTTTNVMIGVEAPSNVSSITSSMTPRAEIIGQAKLPHKERQISSSSRKSIDLTASLVSACTCKEGLTAEAIVATATAIETVTNVVHVRSTVTSYQTIGSGVTTVTATLNSTTFLPIVNNIRLASATWTVMGEPKAVKTSTSSTIASTTSSSATIGWSTIQPSGCPYINGTRFDSVTSKDCTYYERYCSTSYADSDFFADGTHWNSPEECTALCDALNRGGSTCLGIVWNTTAGTSANCRQLKSLKSPKVQADSIAFILQTETNCSSIPTSKINTVEPTITKAPFATLNRIAFPPSTDPPTPPPSNPPSSNFTIPTKSNNTHTPPSSWWKHWTTGTGTSTNLSTTSTTSTFSSCTATTTVYTTASTKGSESWSGWLGQMNRTETVTFTVTLTERETQTVSSCWVGRRPGGWKWPGGGGDGRH